MFALKYLATHPLNHQLFAYRSDYQNLTSFYDCADDINTPIRSGEARISTKEG
ncbi:hypothetical protein LguiA_027897 [Lonicera macranthoides]